MEKDGLFTFEDQIDPAQYMVKKDSIDMDESFDMMRRRSSIPSHYSSKAQVYKPPVPTYGIAAAAFAAGLLVGFMAQVRRSSRAATAAERGSWGQPSF
jgi:hypothetical protein